LWKKRQKKAGSSTAAAVIQNAISLFGASQLGKIAQNALLLSFLPPREKLNVQAKNAILKKTNKPQNTKRIQNYKYANPVKSLVI